MWINGEAVLCLCVNRDMQETGHLKSNSFGDMAVLKMVAVGKEVPLYTALLA